MPNNNLNKKKKRSQKRQFTHKEHTQDNNQPRIKEFTECPKSSQLSVKSVESSQCDQSALEKESNSVKKRLPPTPPERSNPAKRINMGSTNEENSDLSTEIDETVLTPELKTLRALLNLDLEKKLEPLKASISNLEKSHKVLEEKGELIDTIRKENIKLKLDCENVKLENDKLKERLVAIENRLLENNVLLHGIADQPWELNDITHEKTLSAISHVANGKTHEDRMKIVCKIDIRNIKRIGDYSKIRNRPISIEFVKKASADFLFNNKKKLPKGVFLDREYNTETERERQKLRPILRRARELDEYKFKCKLEGNSLIIKGRTYNTGNLSQLPQNLSGYAVSSKSDQETIGFFGELSPYSNFHPCTFTLDNIMFHSSEQYIQYQKAKHFGDTHTARRILQCIDALECKRLAREIPNYDNLDWKNKINELCEPGLVAKFLQNPTLLKLLMSMKDKQLVECSYDTVWGNGLTLRSEHCLAWNEWKGENLLGQMLMSVRDYASTIIGDNITNRDNFHEESMIT